MLAAFSLCTNKYKSMNTPKQLLDALSHEGVLINVSVLYWRANKKLNPEDLGLAPEALTDKLITLGHKRLLPKEALHGFGLIESRVHGLIESTTFPFLNGLGHFLPNTKLEETTSALEKLKTEFQGHRDSFLLDYERLRQEAIEEWELAASKLPCDHGKLLDTIRASFPTSQRLERRFEFKTYLFQISLPENTEISLVEAEDQRRMVEARCAAATEATQSMHRELDAFISDCITSMREQTADLCEQMLQSMRSGTNGIHQKTLNRLIRFIDEFKQLNFVGDQQMEEALERVRQEFLVHPAQTYREDQSAKERLKIGLHGLAECARSFAQQSNQEMVERFGRMVHRKIVRVA